ncbi:hypothetical protein [Bacteroides fragilis]|uniref:hypothetical protein n=2 Tax=Bacteroides fragilis TaxID=817 RepID=UPI001F5498CC|nr:hypothetical protein [Bacteroides fragilis]
MGFTMKLPVCLLIILLASATCFSSCRTQYVPVEKIKTEYRYIDRLQHDSVYLKDSVRYYTKGDTVFADKYLYQYKYLFINRVDSFVKVDSVQVPYPVERKLTRWESMKMELGGWAFGGLIMAIIIVCWLIFKSRSK